jgi:hypothetical protein
MRIHLALLAISIASTNCLAETYKDIGPLDTYGDVIERFPKANFSKISAAWLKKTDALYKIDGEGMSGRIVVKFSDFRPTYLEYAEKNPNSPEAELYKTYANHSDEQALVVEWVRWAPDGPTPLTRLISKYGKPEKSGFSDEDLQPYKRWEAKGLSAYLSDDEKQVLRIDYDFTIAEQRAAYMKKYKYIPPWLKSAQDGKNR